MELLRAQTSENLIAKIGMIARALCMRMAIEMDSSAFYKYYISDILPRYSAGISHDSLLELGNLLELYDETKEFLDEIKPQTENKIIDILPYKREMRSPPKSRYDGKVTTKESKFINRKLNISRTKEVTFARRIILKSSTPPSPPLPSKLSAAALKMRDLLGKSFYKRDETEINLQVQETARLEDHTRVLIYNTPTKPEDLVNPK